MILLDWICHDKLINNNLSKNPNAISFLKENPHKIDWYYISENPEAIDIIKANLDKISWFLLSINKNAIELLHLWTFKMPILVFIILVFSYLIFLNIFGLSIICSI